MVELGGSPEKSCGGAREIDDETEAYERGELVELTMNNLTLNELATDEGSGQGSDERSDETTHSSRLGELLSFSSAEPLNDSPAYHGRLPSGMQRALISDYELSLQQAEHEHECLRFADGPSPEQRSQRPILSLFTERSGGGGGHPQSTRHDQATSISRLEIDDLSPLDRNGQTAPSFYGFEHYSPTEFSPFESSTLKGSRANASCRRPNPHQRNLSNILGLSSSVSSPPISLSSTTRRPPNPRLSSDVGLSWAEPLRNPDQALRHLLELHSTFYPIELAEDSEISRFNYFPSRESISNPWQGPGQPTLVPSIDRRRGQSLSGATQSTDRLLRTQVNFGGVAPSRSTYLFLFLYNDFVAPDDH